MDQPPQALGTTAVLESSKAKCRGIFKELKVLLKNKKSSSTEYDGGSSEVLGKLTQLVNITDAGISQRWLTEKILSTVNLLFIFKNVARDVAASAQFLDLCAKVTCIKASEGDGDNREHHRQVTGLLRIYCTDTQLDTLTVLLKAVLTRSSLSFSHAKWLNSLMDIVPSLYRRIFVTEQHWMTHHFNAEHAGALAWIAWYPILNSQIESLILNTEGDLHKEASRDTVLILERNDTDLTIDRILLKSAKLRDCLRLELNKNSSLDILTWIFYLRWLLSRQMSVLNHPATIAWMAKTASGENNASVQGNMAVLGSENWVSSHLALTIQHKVEDMLLEMLCPEAITASKSSQVELVQLSPAIDKFAPGGADIYPLNVIMETERQLGLPKLETMDEESIKINDSASCKALKCLWLLQGYRSVIENLKEFNSNIAKDKKYFYNMRGSTRKDFLPLLFTALNKMSDKQLASSISASYLTLIADVCVPQDLVPELVVPVSKALNVIKQLEFVHEIGIALHKSMRPSLNNLVATILSALSSLSNQEVLAFSSWITERDCHNLIERDLELKLKSFILMDLLTNCLKAREEIQNVYQTFLSSNALAYVLTDDQDDLFSITLILHILLDAPVTEKRLLHMAKTASATKELDDAIRLNLSHRLINKLLGICKNTIKNPIILSVLLTQFKLRPFLTSIKTETDELHNIRKNWRKSDHKKDQVSKALFAEKEALIDNNDAVGLELDKMDLIAKPGPIPLTKAWANKLRGQVNSRPIEYWSLAQQLRLTEELTSMATRCASNASLGNISDCVIEMSKLIEKLLNSNSVPIHCPFMRIVLDLSLQLNQLKWISNLRVNRETLSYIISSCLSSGTVQHQPTEEPTFFMDGKALTDLIAPSTCELLTRSFTNLDEPIRFLLYVMEIIVAIQRFFWIQVPVRKGMGVHLDQPDDFYDAFTSLNADPETAFPDIAEPDNVYINRRVFLETLVEGHYLGLLIWALASHDVRARWLAFEGLSLFESTLIIECRRDKAFYMRSCMKMARGRENKRRIIKKHLPFRGALNCWSWLVLIKRHLQLVAHDDLATPQLPSLVASVFVLGVTRSCQKSTSIFTLCMRNQEALLREKGFTSALERVLWELLYPLKGRERDVPFVRQALRGQAEQLKEEMGMSDEFKANAISFVNIFDGPINELVTSTRN